MKARRIYVAFSVMLMAVLACNAPSSQQLSPTELAATITSQASTISAPTATSPFPTDTPAPEFTATPSVPEVSVTSPTNCRTGPSVSYDLLYTLNPGESAQVVGKYSAANYWIIDNPNGGTCWLWGQYSVLSGNTANLPEYTPPPVPTPSGVAAPKNFSASSSCSDSGTPSIDNIHVSLTWTDVANNEDGYHIYRNNVLLATLAPNTTSYADDTTITVPPIETATVEPGTATPTLQPVTKIKYSIDAFNNFGHSSLKELNIDCP